MHTGGVQNKRIKDKMSVWVVCVCERREFFVLLWQAKEHCMCVQMSHKNEVETAYMCHVSNVITEWKRGRVS